MASRAKEVAQTQSDSCREYLLQHGGQGIVGRAGGAAESVWASKGLIWQVGPQVC